MILTKGVIDRLAPTHLRTSCNDDNLINGFGGWDGKYDVNTGKKDVRYPRCVRCYLLRNIYMDTDGMDFEIITDVRLVWKELP